MDKAVVATRGRIMSAQSHTNPPSPTPAAPPPPSRDPRYPFLLSVLQNLANLKKKQNWGQLSLLWNCRSYEEHQILIVWYKW